MNNLQKLIRLRGLTIKAVADDTGIGYHSVQKAIKGVARPTDKTKQAIADSLGLDVDRMWGQGSAKYIKEHIKTAIDCRADNHRMRLEERYLRNAA